jgi:hypothetical protein
MLLCLWLICTALSVFSTVSNMQNLNAKFCLWLCISDKLSDIKHPKIQGVVWSADARDFLADHPTAEAKNPG